MTHFGNVWQIITGENSEIPKLWFAGADYWTGIGNGTWRVPSGMGKQWMKLFETSSNVFELIKSFMSV